MSRALFDHSSDLRKLRDEGYEIEIRSNHLLVHNIPYLNSNKEIKYASLVSELTLAGSGDKTAPPSTHVIYFTGDFPCNIDGTEINSLKGAYKERRLFEDCIVTCQFSNKPVGTNRYDNYYDKVKHYANFISSHAKYLNPSVTAQTYKVVQSGEEDSVFHYPDTNSSRAGILAVTEHIINQKIAIIGLGGTGSYLLDLIAKCPVAEIHLFDQDKFLVHNAFRTPGAPTIAMLNKGQKKVNYLAGIYSRMHKHIIPHGEYIDETNVNILKELDFDFVFVSMDVPSEKKIITESLIQWQIPFIDVGMGINLTQNNSLIGTMRTTTGTPANHQHIIRKDRIGFAGGAEDDEYAENIQIAELNALNAAFAVIKWKKLCGFYHDDEKEYHSTLTLNTNYLDSDDHET